MIKDIKQYMKHKPMDKVQAASLSSSSNIDYVQGP